MVVKWRWTELEPRELITPAIFRLHFQVLPPAFLENDIKLEKGRRLKDTTSNACVRRSLLSVSWVWRGAAQQAVSIIFLKICLLTNQQILVKMYASAQFFYPGKEQMIYSQSQEFYWLFFLLLGTRVKDQLLYWWWVCREVQCYKSDCYFNDWIS